MTKKRYIKCTDPMCPHEKMKYFSDYVRENLPPSVMGFKVTDIDFILCNEKTRKIMMVETKTRNKEMPSWQKDIFRNLDKWLRKGIDPSWTYLGFHVVTFQNSTFENGNVYFDGEQVTEHELIYHLSLNY